MTTASRPFLGLLSSGCTRSSSLGSKWLGCEADHSPPFSAKLRMHGFIPIFPQYVFIAWYLKKHRMSSWRG